MSFLRASRAKLVWALELALGLELYACAVLALHARGLRATPVLASAGLAGLEYPRPGAVGEGAAGELRADQRGRDEERYGRGAQAALLSAGQHRDGRRGG